MIALMMPFMVIIDDFMQHVCEYIDNKEGE